MAPTRPSIMSEGAINGNSDTALAIATAKQLGKDMEKSGNTTFTFKELREARRKIIEGE